MTNSNNSNKYHDYDANPYLREAVDTAWEEYGRYTSLSCGYCKEILGRETCQGHDPNDTNHKRWVCQNMAAKEFRVGFVRSFKVCKGSSSSYEDSFFTEEDFRIIREVLGPLCLDLDKWSGREQEDRLCLTYPAGKEVEKEIKKTLDKAGYEAYI